MRVLGVDPGSLTTGWGVVTGTPARPRLLECGVIRLRARTGLAERLHQLQQAFEAVVRRLQPGDAAVEAPFHGPNARSALQLAHARGVVLAVLAGAGLDVAEYAPATVKQAITGAGNAHKEQVQAMVGRLLNTAIATADRADALAVALCHAATLRHRYAISRASRGSSDRRGGGRP